jgi:DNA-binding beta-propeller fold protein YncE
MTKRENAQVLIAAVAVALTSAIAFAASLPPTEGPAQDGSPAWHLQTGFPDPLGRTIVDDQGRVTVNTAGRGGGRGAGAPAAGGRGTGPAAAGALPGCSHSTICGHRGGPNRQQTQRVVWSENLGYTFSYPYHMPPGDGGVPGVAMDSKGNLWALQRAPAGSPQLFKFDKNYKIIATVGDDVIGHQEKAHGVAVDAQDNVWFTDANGETLMKVSPEGKLLATFGMKDKRGDWDEAKGQRLLWQPCAVAFGANGDVYIGEGHANESPNDVDSGDPENNIGAARVIHLDKDGKFINQWFGDEVGQGKFDSIHGMAVDPRTGDVWLADREQYRIVIYNGDGKFLRTMQLRNLICAIAFDSQGNPWITSGQDGQVLKIDRNGKVIGAIGRGMGIEPGQFIEAAFFQFDKQGNIYVGDTSIGRVAKISPPASSASK